MSETASKLLDQIFLLPEADRLMIADRLWESMSDEMQHELMDDATSDPEFQAELERRMASVADGTAQLLEPEEVFAELRKELKRRRDERNRQVSS